MDDWLDTTPAVPAVIPDDYKSRLALAEECWGRLSITQKTFLTAWRDHRFNARAANRTVHGRDETYSRHTQWMHERDYSTVAKIWRANAMAEMLDRDRLLARQDDIVEILLTPKPVLHQGIPVMHEGKILEEVEAGAASRANEVLLDRVVPKPRADVEVGVAVQIPSISVELTERKADKVIDVPCVDVDTAVPDEDWLSCVDVDTVVPDEDWLS